jgi:hypothetical protein
LHMRCPNFAVYITQTDKIKDVTGGAYDTQDRSNNCVYSKNKVIYSVNNTIYIGD